MELFFSKEILCITLTYKLHGNKESRNHLWLPSLLWAVVCRVLIASHGAYLSSVFIVSGFSEFGPWFFYVCRMCICVAELLTVSLLSLPSYMAKHSTLENLKQFR